MGIYKNPRRELKNKCADCFRPIKGDEIFIFNGKTFCLGCAPIYENDQDDEMFEIPE